MPGYFLVFNLDIFKAKLLLQFWFSILDEIATDKGLVRVLVYVSEYADIGKRQIFWQFGYSANVALTIKL